MYRRRTDFNKIIENIKSSTGGGHPVIMMTMFEHNKHQIGFVRDLAESQLVQDHLLLEEVLQVKENYILKTKMRIIIIKAYYPEDDKDIINDNDCYRTEFSENDMPMSDAKDGYIWMNINDIFEQVFDDPA